LEAGDLNSARDDDGQVMSALCTATLELIEYQYFMYGIIVTVRNQD
jgi:hypothetical protein